MLLNQKVILTKIIYYLKNIIFNENYTLYWLVWFIQKIILYGIQAGILLSAQTLAAQGTQARRARLRRALTEAANSDTVPIIKTVQKKKYTHTQYYNTEHTCLWFIWTFFSPTPLLNTHKNSTSFCSPPAFRILSN